MVCFMKTKKSIDKSVVSFCSLYSAKQYIKSVPVKFGYKLRMLCSCHWFPYNFETYCCKDSTRTSLPGNHVVKKILCPVTNKTKHVVLISFILQWLYLAHGSSSCSSYSVFIRYCPRSRAGRIYPIPSEIAWTPSLNFALFRAFFFKSIFFHLGYSRSSSVVLSFFSHLLQKSKATIKTLSPSLLNTYPYFLTTFAVANRSIVSFNPSMSICSSVVFLSTTI